MAPPAPLALTQSQGAILAVVGGALLLAAGAFIASRAQRVDRGPDIPRTMRPGPSDPDLETPILTRLQTWGVILVVFFVVWVPIQWLVEPSTNLEQERALKTDSIDRGRRSVLPFTEENQIGVGCVRCHGPELRGQVIQAAGSEVQAPDLTTVCGGPSTGHALITAPEDVRTTIEQGRGAMPSWSIRFAGALDDQQIDDIIQYLISINEENVPFADNVCINPEAGQEGGEGG